MCSGVTWVLTLSIKIYLSFCHLKKATALCRGCPFSPAMTKSLGAWQVIKALSLAQTPLPRSTSFLFFLTLQIRYTPQTHNQPRKMSPISSWLSKFLTERRAIGQPSFALRLLCHLIRNPAQLPASLRSTSLFLTLPLSSLAHSLYTHRWRHTVTGPTKMGATR